MAQIPILGETGVSRRRDIELQYELQKRAQQEKFKRDLLGALYGGVLGIGTGTAKAAIKHHLFDLPLAQAQAGRPPGLVEAATALEQALAEKGRDAAHKRELGVGLGMRRVPVEGQVGTRQPRGGIDPLPPPITRMKDDELGFQDERGRFGGDPGVAAPATRPSPGAGQPPLGSPEDQARRARAKSDAKAGGVTVEGLIGEPLSRKERPSSKDALAALRAMKPERRGTDEGLPYDSYRPEPVPEPAIDELRKVETVGKKTIAQLKKEYEDIVKTPYGAIGAAARAKQGLARRQEGRQREAHFMKKVDKGVKALEVTRLSESTAHQIAKDGRVKWNIDRKGRAHMTYRPAYIVLDAPYSYMAPVRDPLTGKVLRMQELWTVKKYKFSDALAAEFLKKYKAELKGETYKMVPAGAYEPLSFGFRSSDKGGVATRATFTVTLKNLRSKTIWQAFRKELIIQDKTASTTIEGLRGEAIRALKEMDVADRLLRTGSITSADPKHKNAWVRLTKARDALATFAQEHGKKEAKLTEKETAEVKHTDSVFRTNIQNLYNTYADKRDAISKSAAAKFKMRGSSIKVTMPYGRESIYKRGDPGDAWREEVAMARKAPPKPAGYDGKTEPKDPEVRDKAVLYEYGKKIWEHSARTWQKERERRWAPIKTEWNKKAKNGKYNGMKFMDFMENGKLPAPQSAAPLAPGAPAHAGLPGATAQPAGGRQTSVPEQLFMMIEAQPWSKQKKQSVFDAQLKQAGLA